MDYDIIIAGAGLGGLSYAHSLIRSGDTSKSVLILDATSKNQNDRTWSFWSEKSPDYACAHHQVWDQLGFASDNFIKYEALNPYRYYTIHGIDFYKEVLEEIEQSTFITLRKEEITAIIDEDSHFLIQTEKNSYQAEYVIDSVTRPNIENSKTILNWQNFIGWKIETEKKCFDSSRPILMDFRVPQTSSANFVYLLPYSAKEALVEYTQFSPSKQIDQYSIEKELSIYITDILKVKNYRIIEKEIGTIPMTNFKFDPNPSSKLFRIGTNGGDTKPTTGYTFQNVQDHCSLINQQINGGSIPADNKLRFSFYDNLLLGIIENHPNQVKSIMSVLFQTQPFSRILKFLDEDTSTSEEFKIFSNLPWMPFLKQLFADKKNVIQR